MNIFKDDVLIGSVEVSNNFFTSSLGLMFKKEMSRDVGLLIKSGSCGVHGCFMMFSLDVVFLSKDLVVVDIAHLYPWRAYITQCRHSFILELVSGCVRDKNLIIGDILNIKGG